METFIPTSSHLDRVDYEQADQTMTVTFKDGQSYIYRQVPQPVFLGIQNAQSPGEYHARNIRGRYAYEPA